MCIAAVVATAGAAGYGLGLRHAPSPPGFADTQRGHLARLDGAALPGRVVFLGSSTFQGLDVAAITPYALNLSIGGDTLPALLARSADYRSLAQAHAVWLNIGLNDLMRHCALPAPEATAALLARIEAPRPLFVLGLQQVSGDRHATRCDGGLAWQVDAFNRQLMRQCGDRPGCVFVPNPLTAEPPAPAAWHEADGIHLSAPGYAVLIERMRAALAQTAPALLAAPPPPLPSLPPTPSVPQ